MSLPELLDDILKCRICAHSLPLGPRPVVKAQSSASVLIIGQAPGTRVHETGIPWNDKSGERLRDWLQVEPEHFYDTSRIAIVPMGFCYPGVNVKGGDLPPRPECAPEWHQKILQHLPNVKLTLLIGQYSQKHYLGKRRGKTLTETVHRFKEYGPSIMPLPHPSWRTQGWQRKNPWFDEILLPELRQKIHSLLEV